MMLTEVAIVIVIGSHLAVAHRVMWAHLLESPPNALIPSIPSLVGRRGPPAAEVGGMCLLLAHVAKDSLHCLNLLFFPLRCVK